MSEPRQRIRSQEADAPKKGQAAVAVEELRDRSEAGFCRATRPVLWELRGSVDRHVRCVSANYVEAGYFGTTADLATSSFHNACFGGSTSRGESLEYIEHPIPKLSRSRAVSKIGADARLDLSRYGIVPATYVLENPRGVTGAMFEVWFDDPVVRQPTNLAATLVGLASDERGSPEARSSAASCLKRLCSEQAVHTRQIVSARPRVRVRLQGGTATGLRPTTADRGVSVDGDGQEFTIRPASRVNLAAVFQPSRSALQAACLEEREVQNESTGVTPPCSTVIHHGIHAMLSGCVRSSRTVVTCHFSLTSPGRDRTLEVHVNAGRNSASTLVDEKGSSRSAHVGNSGSTWEERKLELSLVADAPTTVALEFRDVDSSVARFSRVRLSGETDREVSFDFREVVTRSALDQCRVEASP